MDALAGKGFTSRGKSRELAVVLHGYSNSGKSMESVADLVADLDPDCDLYVPDLDLGILSSNIDHTVADLFLMIDHHCENRQGAGGYNRIIFVGHSLGSLIARKIYVCAWGADYCGYIGQIYEDKLAHLAFPRPWACKVERIVLLAGMNRGWRISHHLGPLTLARWYFGNMLALFYQWISRKPLVILSMKRGGDFITQLRIQWIHMKNSDPGGVEDEHSSTIVPNRVMTIQLLGSVDDFVSPEDNVDLISGQDFVYLDVPYSNHTNVIEMTNTCVVEVPNSGAEEIGKIRSGILRLSLTKTKDELQEVAVLPSDNLPPESSNKVTDVVFVIHGIRDTGHWTHKIARTIQKLARQSGKTAVIATETSSYGYFAMLPFMLRGTRRRKIAWLMDEYAEALARYPKAQFSFVGHSNGTFMLAHALEKYRSCRFKNVVFAGSVVNRAYDWDAIRDRKQVDKIINYVATKDWVVAIFPKLFQYFPKQDLGSAGHDGFFPSKGSDTPFLLNKSFIKGAHGAAIVEENWHFIAEFILTGNEPPFPASLEGKPSTLVRILGILSPLIWATGIALILGTGSLIWTSSLSEGLRVFLLMIVGLSIWKIITTV